MDFYEDIAGQYAANAYLADEKTEVITQGLCGVTYALLDVAAAIREAAGLRERKLALDDVDPNRAIFFRRY